MNDSRQLELWGWDTREYWETMTSDYRRRKEFIEKNVNIGFKQELKLLASAVEAGMYLDFSYKIKLNRYMRKLRKRSGYGK